MKQLPPIFLLTGNQVNHIEVFEIIDVQSLETPRSGSLLTASQRDSWRMNHSADVLIAWLGRLRYGIIGDELATSCQYRSTAARNLNSAYHSRPGCPTEAVNTRSDFKHGMQ